MALDYSGNVGCHSDLSTIATHRDVNIGTFMVWAYITSAANGHLAAMQDSVANAQRINPRLSASGVNISCNIDLVTSDILMNVLVANFASYGLNKWLAIAFQWKTPNEAGGVATDQKILMGDYAGTVLGTTGIAEPSSYVNQSVGSGDLVATDATTFWKIGNSGNANTAAPKARIAYATLIRRNSGSQLTVAEMNNWFRFPHVMPGCQFLFELGAGADRQIDMSGNGITFTNTLATVGAHVALDPFGSTRELQSGIKKVPSSRFRTDSRRLNHRSTQIFVPTFAFTYVAPATPINLRDYAVISNFKAARKRQEEKKKRSRRSKAAVQVIPPFFFIPEPTVPAVPYTGSSFQKKMVRRRRFL